MVRLFWVRYFEPRRLAARSACRASVWTLIIGLLLHSAGCALAPRSQVDECHQLSRTLRAENARLRDQLLTAQSQNEDYAERAVDDARRLTLQDEAIERLEHSVQAYQDERGRPGSVKRKLTSSVRETGPGPDDRLDQSDAIDDSRSKPRPSASNRSEKDRRNPDQVESKR